MVRAHLLVAGLIAACCQAHAAQRTIDYSDQECSYSARYDPAKVDLVRLRSTIDLLYHEDQVPADEPMLLSVDDLKRADLPRYEAWCKAATARLDGVSLIDLEGLDDLRRQRIAEIADRCRLVSTEFAAAHGNISALEGYKPAAACKGFADRLAQPDADFRSSWASWIKQRCIKNSRPDCLESYRAEAAKPDGMQRMRLGMLVFGWYNCANRQSLISRNADQTHGGGSRLRREVLARFEKTFSAKRTCEVQD